MLESQKDCGFNLALANECIEAFHTATGLSTTISGLQGECYASYGESCADCQICKLVSQYTKRPENCAESHLYGMAQAQRFGGKYIYFCPSGFNFIISPIMTNNGPAAYAKAGPFLMVDRDDYVKYDLMDLLHVPQKELAQIVPLLEEIPFIPPDRVSKYSTMLFMSIGFVNNIDLCAEMIRTQDSDRIQGQIGEILRSLKTENDETALTYPFDKENALLEAIADGDRPTASRLLNELLGYIFFYSGGNFEIIRARVFELIVLLSRAAINGGADANHIFGLNYKYINEINNLQSVDDLCFWLSDVMNRFTDYVFRFTDVKHVDVIRKSVDYIRRNYAKKITLEEVAAHVYLSPSYFSKVFKEEMDCNFNTYLNRVRIDKSKQLLLSDKVKLVDISGMVGFEDQSYFSKVFKKLTGVTPGKFREARGKLPRENKFHY